MKRLLALAAICLSTAGCASVGPLAPLSGGTARQAWQELERAANVDGTLGTYASVRVTTPSGRRSFRATIQADGGVVRMSAFTPVGTEVFAFEVRGDEMVFADHGARKTWRGPFADVARQLGIPDQLSAADFARLLFGLPAAGGDADLSEVGRGVVRRNGLEYEVSGVGLASVFGTGAGWRVRYEPVAFPPQKVTFDDDDGGRSITVRHLDLSHTPRGIEPLVVDGSYTCCFRPLIGGE